MDKRLTLHATWRRVFHVTITGDIPMSGTHVNQRVQKHRDALRAAGLRPIQIWVPDTRRAGFAEECYRQSMLVAQADANDPALDEIMDEALNDIEGWSE